MCAFGISRHPRGAALVIVMLVMAVLLMAGTTFLTISSTESQIALNEQGSATAQVLAEAAVHKALAFYYANANSTYAGETNTVLGGGTFTINVTTVPGCTSTSARKIRAVASAPIRGGVAQTTLEVTIDQVSYPYRWATFAAVPNGIIGTLWDPLAGQSRDRTNSELWLRNNTLTDSFDSGAGPYDQTTNSALHGNVGANGDVKIDYNSAIDGNVQAGDEFDKDSGVSVTGTEVSGLSPHVTDPGVPFPSVSAPGSTTTDLNVTSGTRTLAAGTYVYRNVSLSDGTSLAISGPVKIYITGTASIGDNVTFGSHPGTQLQIITKSDGGSYDTSTFYAGSNFKLYGSLYGKNTDIYLGYGSQIYGSIIGRTVRARSGSIIHYDQAMSNREVCHNGKFTIRRGTWREVIPST